MDIKQMVKDPVCGMELNPGDAVMLEEGGKVFYFCSLHCKNTFQHRGHIHEGKPSHIAHHIHMVQDFKKRFWFSLIATIPVLILSPLIQSLFKFSFQFAGDRLVLFGISTFIFFYGGLPFLKGIVEELKKKQPGMMTLVALAISVAYLYSSVVVFGVEGEVFFWELVTLIDIMLLGHWIEMRQVVGASRALEKLAKFMPSEAHLVLADGSIRNIRTEELEPGNKVLIKPGEKVPGDGDVVDGESEVNEAMITGESRPVIKKRGSQVIGGSVNGTGVLIVEVKKTGKETYLSRMSELVRRASETKSRAQDLANRAAFWLTIIGLVAAGLTFTAWFVTGKGFEFALERMVTVMVITCPHALGLAIPLVVAVISGLSARRGLLIKNRTAFENARNLEIVLFDKTGTLTKGEFGVSDVISLGDWNKDELLRKVASLEVNSEHSIAKAIVKSATERNLYIPKAAKFTLIPGRGAKGEVEGEEIYIGNKGILALARAEAKKIEKQIEQIASQGKTVVLAVCRGKVQGIIALSDMIREESKEAVERLKNLGLETAMITGDNEVTARYVAGQLGLTTYFAEVLPEEKTEKIKALQREGRKVAMVGDGLNDAPSLAQADLGIAIGAGTDIAAETADLILVKNDPRNIVDVIRLSRIMHRKMVENLAWATGYNVVAIPLAAGLLFRHGIVLPPAVGALAMSLSTIIVAFNARLVSYPLP